MDEAISLALERNLALIVQRYNEDESEQNLRRSQGVYDLNLTSMLAALDETTPSASTGPPRTGQLDTSRPLPMIRRTVGPALTFQISRPDSVFKQ